MHTTQGDHGKNRESNQCGILHHNTVVVADVFVLVKVIVEYKGERHGEAAATVSRCGDT
jgi:hypothetical protein